MALKLFDRIATLLKADAHGVIESLEDRKLLLQQYLREAEIEIGHKRARLETVREEEKRLGETFTRREQEIRSLDEDVALALAGGKDDLARFAIRRLIPRRREQKALVAEIERRAEETRSLSARLAAQEAQFENLRTRVRAELAHAREPDEPSLFAGEPAVADEEVELELLRRRGDPGARSVEPAARSPEPGRSPKP